MTGMFDCLFWCTYYEQSIRVYCCHDHTLYRVTPYSAYFSFASRLTFRFLRSTLFAFFVYIIFPFWSIALFSRYSFYPRLRFIINCFYSIVLSSLIKPQSLFSVSSFARPDNITGAFHPSEIILFPLR